MYVWIYVFVCFFVYVCMNMHVYMYVCMCVYVYVPACLCICMSVCVCMYVSMCLCVYVSVGICVHVYMCICACLCVPVCVYMCGHVCVCMSCVCMYMSVCGRACLQASMWHPEGDRSITLYFVCLDKVFHWAWSLLLSSWARLASKCSQSACLYTPPPTEVQAHKPMPNFLPERWGLELTASCLCDSDSYLQHHLSSTSSWMLKQGVDVNTQGLVCSRYSIIAHCDVRYWEVMWDWSVPSTHTCMCIMYVHI